ncbi:MAG TPA: transglutaminaseTgpA domain-containing protein [Gaiellales bacterium]|nr:transglutaminaseTgpA domain-containing protein [Gaiellales bacterium]
MDRVPRPRIAPAVLAGALLLFGGWHWARLEQPHMAGGGLLVLALLAALPTLAALLGRGRGTVLLTFLAATIAAIGAIAHTWPWQTQHGVYPVRVSQLIVNGLRDWFGTHTPIDAGRFPGANHDLRLAFFAAACAIIWLIVRRGAALPAIGVAFALFAMPSTVLPLHADAFRAGVFLMLALLTLVATSERSGRPLAGDSQVVGLSVAVVLAGLIVGTAPGVTKSAFLSWQSWNPLAHDGPQVSVDYMWNQNYAPLHWPKKRTQVLEVSSKKKMYWKAATLDTFLIDHWQFSSQGQVVGTSNGGSLSEPLNQLPLRARFAPKLDTVNVKVLGLADDHLVGAGQPVKWSIPDGVQSLLDADGTVTTLSDVARKTEYSVSVYDPSPTAGQLTNDPNGFPRAIRDGIVVGNMTIPTYPKKLPKGMHPLSAAFMAASDQAWINSQADKADTEYEATIALEHYFRSKPFHYTLTPHLTGKVPALADFMLFTHHGYCQMFSGAMALVLRLHGIPARVAVGFMPGKLQGSDTYLVNDRDAHAWVEVYFPGYGWIPFEPTPGSHLPSNSSTSSPAFASIRTGGGGTPPGLTTYLGAIFGGKGNINALNAKHHAEAEAVGGGRTPSSQIAIRTAGSGSGHGRFFTWLITITAVVLVAILALKAIAVRWRYLRRGPRAKAAAAYHDLATFVGDQGMEVRPEDTFEELAERVDSTFGVDAKAFASSATRARYAPLPVAEDEARQLRRQLRSIKHDVRERLTPRERFGGALRLRAVLSQATLGS